MVGERTGGIGTVRGLFPLPTTERRFVTRSRSPRRSVHSSWRRSPV